MRTETKQLVTELSVIMQYSEDIVKACEKAELHPAVIEVLLKLHEENRLLQEELRTQRTNILEIAKVMEQMTDNVVSIGQFVQSKFSERNQHQIGEGDWSSEEAKGD